MQAEWFKNLINSLESEQVTAFEAKEEAAATWQEEVRQAWEMTLLAKTKIRTPRHV